MPPRQSIGIREVLIDFPASPEVAIKDQREPL
jgi:hypothetical protein